MWSPRPSSLCSGASRAVGAGVYFTCGVGAVVVSALSFFKLHVLVILLLFLHQEEHANSHASIF